MISAITAQKKRLNKSDYPIYCTAFNNFRHIEYGYAVKNR